MFSSLSSIEVLPCRKQIKDSLLPKDYDWFKDSEIVFASCLFLNNNISKALQEDIKKYYVFAINSKINAEPLKYIKSCLFLN